MVFSLNEGVGAHAVAAHSGHMTRRLTYPAVASGSYVPTQADHDVPAPHRPCGRPGRRQRSGHS
eukprot:9505-Eustigmatos_ZCMA.PRE.1